MKKTTVLSLSAMLLCTITYAQAPDYRFGKVSEEELRMTVYEKDPEAGAVILYEENRMTFPIENSIDRITEYRARIKILKQEGTDRADVEIGYLHSNNMKETVSGLEAAAYNLENGKIVKTPLKKQYVFIEKIDENNQIIKFSIPEVRAGTVIEYRYKLTSPNVTYLPAFRFQHTIPVARSHMQAEIPEFFRVRLNLKGHQRISIDEKSGSGSIHNSDGSIGYTYTKRIISADAEDLPALKKEPFIWCLNDFRSMLDFELSQIALPGHIIQNFSGSWASVNSTLEKSSFNTSCRIGNPFKEEVTAIRAKDTTPREKAREVLKLVQSRIKWNGNYRLFSDRPRIAVQEGSGSSAAIGFVLMAALKDAGFKVVPILLSPRHRGRLPYTHPTIDGIRTFVLRIDIGNGEYAYADATDPNSDLDILPEELLVDRARIYGVDGDEGWCDLTKLTKSSQTVNMVLRLDEEGTLGGHIIEEYRNQAALATSTEYTEAQSEGEYIDDMEKEQNIRIENFKISGIGTPCVRQEYDIISTPDATGEFVYLKATILPFLSTNPFISQSRMFPVEFPEMRLYNIRCSLALPEGYSVEEKPKSIAMAACENGMLARYIAQVSGPNVQFAFIFSTNRLVFLPEEYADLNAFFGMVADLNNSQLVIRKNTQE